jgi:hypothetical protein
LSYQSIKDKAKFDDTKDDIENFLNDLERYKKRLTSHSLYKFNADLDKVFNVLREQCQSIQNKLKSEMAEIKAGFRAKFEKLVDVYEKTEDEFVNGTLSEKSLKLLELEIERFNEKLEDSKKDSNLQTDNIGWIGLRLGNVVHMVESVLDYYNNSPVKLNGNHAIYANEAEYIETGKAKTDPDGILYIADDQLTFQQKEVVGKTLGLFGGKKKDEILWCFRLENISDVTSEIESGFLDSKHYIQFSADGKIYKVRLKAGWSAKVLTSVINFVKKQEWESAFESILEEYNLTKDKLRFDY